jgi:molybdopterin-guanine dinucleotide biosynthesis protein
VKIVTIAGAPGSGKTTLIRELIARLGAHTRTASVIVNQEGEESYSQAFLESYGVKVFLLRGG